MKIVSWNVNGIRAIDKKGVFIPFIKKYKPDILCIQETKAYKEQSPIDLSEYFEFWNSAEKKGYSGTAIFTKEKPKKIIFDLPKDLEKKYKLADNYGDTNKEGRIITAEFKEFYIVSVYTPNSKQDLSRLDLRYKNWDPAFLKYLKKLDKEKPVIFCGDLNVAHTEEDLANPDTNHLTHGFTDKEREGIENLIKLGFMDTFRIFTKGNGHYSWWSHFANARARNVGWRIDYIFVSNRLKNKVKQAKILTEVTGSDHCPVFLELK